MLSKRGTLRTDHDRTADAGLLLSVPDVRKRALLLVVGAGFGVGLAALDFGTSLDGGLFVAGAAALSFLAGLSTLWSP